MRVESNPETSRLEGPSYSNADLPQGETSVPLQLDDIPNHLGQVDRTLGKLTFLRRVANFQAVDGTEYTSALDEVDLSPHETLPGHYWAELKSHKKSKVLITGAVVLAVAGVGVRLQRNRTQRNKMGNKKNGP